MRGWRRNSGSSRVRLARAGHMLPYLQRALDMSEKETYTQDMEEVEMKAASVEWKVSRNNKSFIGIPKPSSDAELEILSELYFGAPLHLRSLSAYESSASYEVSELYDSYHGSGWQFGKGDIRGYDHSAKFWRHVVGELSCGGIAGRSYGQTHVQSHRDYMRLKIWVDSRRRKDSGRIRKPFSRLADHLRDRREKSDSR